MDSFRLMMDAGKYLPPHIQPWLLWMQVVLFLGPLIFIKYLPARLLLIAQLLNIVVAYSVFVAEGNEVTKLFGVGHLFWLVPLWFLAKDIRSDKWIAYRAYAAVAVITISISLVFDVKDTASWIMGDRSSVLVNVPIDTPPTDPS